MQSDYKVTGLGDARLTKRQLYYLSELRDLLIACESEGIAVTASFVPKNPTLSIPIELEIVPND